MVDCLNPDVLLALRDWERSDVFESFETSEIEEPRGEFPGRCDVTYGPKLLEVRLGRGEYGLLAGWGVEDPDE